jgi:hypothetical protein
MDPSIGRADLSQNVDMRQTRARRRATVRCAAYMTRQAETSMDSRRDIV